MSDTEKLLTEIEEACARATPAPWRACAWDPMERPHVHKDTPEQRSCHVGNDLPVTGPDAHLIANARTWLPQLAEIVRDLQTVRASHEISNRTYAALIEGQQKQLEEMRAELAARDAQIQRLIQGEAIESDYMPSMDDKLLAALNEIEEMRAELTKERQFSLELIDKMRKDLATIWEMRKDTVALLCVIAQLGESTEHLINIDELQAKYLEGEP